MTKIIKHVYDKFRSVFGGSVKSTAVLNVKFGGESYIDAELFAKTILTTVNLVKLSSKYLDSNSDVEIRINENKDGSFETIVEFIFENKDSFFNFFSKAGSAAVTVVTFSSGVMITVLYFLQIKKHLKGESAKLPSKIRIEYMVDKNNVLIDGTQKYFIEEVIGNIIMPDENTLPFN